MELYNLWTIREPCGTECVNIWILAGNHKLVFGKVQGRWCIRSEVQRFLQIPTILTFFKIVEIWESTKVRWPYKLFSFQPLWANCNSKQKSNCILIGCTFFQEGPFDKDLKTLLKWAKKSENYRLHIYNIFTNLKDRMAQIKCKSYVMHTETSKLLYSFSQKYENHCIPVSHAATASGLFFTAFYGKETRRGETVGRPIMEIPYSVYTVQSLCHLAGPWYRTDHARFSEPIIFLHFYI